MGATGGEFGGERFGTEAGKDGMFDSVRAELKTEALQLAAFFPTEKGVTFGIHAGLIEPGGGKEDLKIGAAAVVGHGFELTAEFPCKSKRVSRDGDLL